MVSSPLQIWDGPVCYEVVEGRCWCLLVFPQHSGWGGGNMNRGIWTTPHPLSTK
jgi:hypothetical protein